MRITKVYARFYKSFNFDYERRAKGNADRHDWEMLPEGWHPHVRVDLDPSITAVVGANEAGKSHLLDVIECVAGKKSVLRRDFCRHSQLYTVDTDEIKIPDVGVELYVATESEITELAALGLQAHIRDRVLFMRPGGLAPFLLLGDARVDLEESAVARVEQLLPKIVRLSTETAIPDSVSISALWGGTSGAFRDRRRRSNFLDFAESLPSAGTSELSEHLERLLEFLRPGDDYPEPEMSKMQRERELARQLLVDVAKVDPRIFRDLQTAITNGHEGDVGGLVAKVNQNLSKHLNLTRWWTQDQEFELRVEARERELVFTIRDRTGTDYSFGERSRGLTHFLAYYVQLRAHQRDPYRSEILLMDEPDAYLSNTGQQDLLRVLENYALPDDQARRDQVMYVTHSPYLINRNAAHRIRLLDKGAQEEGTRVVKDVARTRYEPLRSSLGAYVAETTFIGGKNLIVEGVADQVLLAGMSSLLRKRDADPHTLLDLNEITIVPAGSADSIPYVAYLARGRDPVKPPCVVLLDGDKSGRAARNKLKKSAVDRRPVIDDKFVLQVDEWIAEHSDQLELVGASRLEIEDLVPLKVALRAARRYARRLLGVDDKTLEKLKESSVRARMDDKAGKAGLWDALAQEIKEVFDGQTMDKVGFAREILEDAEENTQGSARPAGVPALEKNFQELLSHLTALLNQAAVVESEQRRNRRTGRVIKKFLEDYVGGATKSLAESRLSEIETTLDDIAEHDIIRQRLTELRRDFSLRKDPQSLVPDFERFRDSLSNLVHEERLQSQEEDDS